MVSEALTWLKMVHCPIIPIAAEQERQAKLLKLSSYWATGGSKCLKLSDWIVGPESKVVRGWITEVQSYSHHKQTTPEFFKNLTEINSSTRGWTDSIPYPYKGDSNIDIMYSPDIGQTSADSRHKSIFQLPGYQLTRSSCELTATKTQSSSHPVKKS